MNWDTLHHAYLFSGAGDGRVVVDAFLKKAVNAGSLAGSPDCFSVQVDRLGVGDVAPLVSHAFTKPVQLPYRIIVLSCADITIEAQNALLKVLEEPRARAIFFIVHPSVDTLLPTLRSRVQIEQSLPTQKYVGSAQAAQFASGTMQTRLDIVKELLATRDDDEVRTLVTLSTFLQDIEYLLAPRVKEAVARRGLRSLYAAKQALTTAGAALKPMLEQVAVLFPHARA